MSDDIKAVIWDVGGVLIRTQDHSGRRKWEQELGLPIGGTDEVVFHSRQGTQAQLGQITDDELWQWVGERLALGVDLEAFRTDFWAGDELDQSLIRLIRELRPAYKMAIISNATDGLLQSLTEVHHIADDFDLIMGSAYEHILKPSPEIYRRTLDRLGLSASECIFIDDAPANIAGAEFVGLHAIRFTPALDIRAALRKSGVAVT